MRMPDDWHWDESKHRFNTAGTPGENTGGRSERRGIKYRMMHMTEQKFRAVRGISFSIAFLLPLFPELALPRDLDGKYANSPFKQWFDSLASRRGPCCSVADGQGVEDVDWDTKNGQYRVRLDGQWIEVPADALVTVPNKFGPAVVWPYKDYEGRTQIRCFIPGAGG
jgi:hypothetical protein